MQAGSQALQRTAGAPTQGPQLAMGAGATVAFGSHLPKRTGSVGQVQDGPWFPFSSGLVLPSGAVSRSPCPELPSLWSARTLQQVESLLLPTVATPPSVLPSGPVSCAGLRPRSPGARKANFRAAAMLSPWCADPWSGCLRARSRASMVRVGPFGARRGRCVPFRHTWSPAV